MILENIIPLFCNVNEFNQVLGKAVYSYSYFFVLVVKELLKSYISFDPHLGGR